MKDIKIDFGKKRTLERLSEKGDTEVFDIDESYLVKVDDCSLCGSDNITPIAEVYHKKDLLICSTASCNDCLYTFRPVSPSFEWFKKCWKQIASDKLEVFNPKIEEIRAKRYEEYYNTIRDHLKGKRVLDIGAAYGTGSKVFKDHGFDVETIEPEDNKANYIQKVLEIPVRSSSIEDFLFLNEKYDAVIFAHCLEHLDNPKGVMSEIRDLLNPQGILYLEVPNMWNHVTWNDALYSTHKSNFIPENLTNLVRENELEVISETHFRHSENEPIDFGLVLRPSSVLEKNMDYMKKYGIDDVKRIYRKNIPLDYVPSLNEVLRYNVDQIEHILQMVRLDKKRVVEPKSPGDFISFETI